MKNRLVSTIVMASLAFGLVACGSKDSSEGIWTEQESATENAQNEDVVEEASSEVTEESNDEVTGAENAEGSEEVIGMANPWRSCTEEEANSSCPRLFKAPEGATVNGWRMMDPENAESGVPGQLVELDFSMDGLDYTARAQYGVGEDVDIAGMFYEWDVTDDITLANWGEGHMQGKLSRHIEDGWMIDLCTWYDIEIGIAYSLSVEGEDLEGFDLQAVAEQMYNAENEPLVDAP